jgi:hypothetical protein
MEDSILYWNDVAIEATRVDYSTPDPSLSPTPEQLGATRVARLLAIVHRSGWTGAAGSPPRTPRRVNCPSGTNAGANAQHLGPRQCHTVRHAADDALELSCHELAHHLEHRTAESYVYS